MGPEAASSRHARWWPAPAKLNLFLHITGRRSDGMHELQTLFQILDWGDEVFVQPTEDPEILRRRADYDIPAEDDIAIRAARRLQSETGVSRGAVIEIRKNVPIGAGLGGGSSDAATVLTVLNAAWQCGLSVDALAGMALELGADVPLFLRGRSALATGVGEELQPVELGPRHYLLVMPELPVSTAEIFADPALKRDSAPITLEQALAGDGRNDCQAVVVARYPELSELLDRLAKYGTPRMSGTGSVLFVPMPSARESAAAAEDLKCRYNVRAVGGLDRSPLLKALSSMSPG